MLFNESVLVLVLYILAFVVLVPTTGAAGVWPYPLLPSYPLPLALPLPFSVLFLPLLALEFDTPGTVETPKADFAALTLGTATGVPEATPSADAELEEEGLPELGANPGVSGERCG